MLKLLLSISPIVLFFIVYFIWHWLKNHWRSSGSALNSNVKQLEEDIFNIVKINYKGARQNLKDTLKKQPSHSSETLNPMPSFMYEATDGETMTNFELPDEIRMAMRHLRIFLSGSTNVALRILKEAETHYYDDKELIFDDNTLVKFIYIVIYGSVTLKTRILDIADTFVNFNTGDCIFNFSCIIQGMTTIQNPANASAYASGECALVKIPIEFFSQNENKLRFIETAVTWRERFIDDIVINTLKLTDYISTNDYMTKCSCNCDDSDTLLVKAHDILREKLDMADEEFKEIISLSKLIIYQNHETIEAGKYVYFLTHGRFQESILTNDNIRMKIMGWSLGHFIGIQNLFVQRQDKFRLRALSKNTTVIRWDSEDALKMASKYPKFLDIMLVGYLDDYTKFVRSIEWLASQNEFPRDTKISKSNLKPNSIYVVMSGRIRSILQNNFGSKRSKIIEEFGHGDVITSKDMLIKGSMDYYYIAVRFTTIVSIPYQLIKILESIMNLPVPILTKVYQNLASKMYLANNDHFLDRALSNIKTIAVVSGSNSVPIRSFGNELILRLKSYEKKSILLDSQIICKNFNERDTELISSMKLMSYLRSLESQYDSLLMICDQTLTKWTSHVLEQADVIVVVLNFLDTSREPQGIESRILDMKYKTSRILAFLHPNDTKIISGTNEWLKIRSGYQIHFHIRCSETFFQIDHQVNDEFSKFDHFSRLARHLTGNALGFAFGGGGARGYSHLGIIREFLDQNIPIDLISGTSIGAFIGAIFAIYENPDDTDEKTKEWSKFMKTKINHIIDLTIPYISIFSGRQFSYILRQIFGSINIEDFWIPFYCITTDLTTETKCIHKTGPANIYIHASMCIVGYLPPVCDPKNGHLLVDGGYVDLVPAIDLVQAGCFRVFAIIVNSSSYGLYHGHYGSFLSATTAFLYKFLPFHHNKLPTYFSLISNLSFISSTLALNSLKECDERICFLTPDVQMYQTHDFALFDVIYARGKKCAQEFFQTAECITCLVSGTKSCTKCMKHPNDSFNQTLNIIDI